MDTSAPGAVAAEVKRNGKAAATVATAVSHTPNHSENGAAGETVFMAPFDLKGASSALPLCHYFDYRIMEGKSKGRGAANSDQTSRATAPKISKA
jgi:hypothetical protein